MKKNAQLKILVQCLICALTYTRKKFEAYWIKHFCFTDRRIFLYFSVPQPQNLAQKFILVQKVFISPYFTSGYYFIMICMHIKAYIANLVFHLCTTLCGEPPKECPVAEGFPLSTSLKYIMGVICHEFRTRAKVKLLEMYNSFQFLQNVRLPNNIIVDTCKNE